MKISFIIINYQSSSFLKRCIESIYEHAPFASYEIVLANNDTEDIGYSFDTASVKIINNRENIGFSRACNIAAKQSEGEILFFLNPDTEITTSNVDDLIDILKDKAIGIVAPELILPSGNIQPWSTGKMITPLRLLMNNIRQRKNFSFAGKKNTTGLIETDWVSGGAFVITKDLFSRCRGFDEKFFLYFEDVDLCKRIKSLGKKIVLLPSVKVLHLGGQSVSDAKKQKTFYYQSQDYYFRKHFGLIPAYFIKLLRNLALFLGKIQNNNKLAN